MEVRQGINPMSARNLLRTLSLSTVLLSWLQVFQSADALYTMETAWMEKIIWVNEVNLVYLLYILNKKHIELTKLVYHHLHDLYSWEKLA